MAVRIAKKIPANKFLVDDEDFPIMRYMNLSKYVYLLTTKSLYIPCSQKLNDRLEGILSIRNAKKAVEQFYSKGATYLKSSSKKWEDYNNVLKQFKMKNPRAKIDKEKLISFLISQAGDFQSKFSISSWTISETSSFTLFNQYGQTTEGLALRTTKSKLVSQVKKFCDKNRDKIKQVKIGKVEYSYKERLRYNGILTIDDFFTKDAMFSAEKELRVVIEWKESIVFERIEIPLTDKADSLGYFIDKVHIHPTWSSGSIMHTVIKGLHSAFEIPTPRVACNSNNL